MDGRDERSGRRYVYAIVAAETAAPRDVKGLDGRPLAVIRQGSVSALVSTVDSDRVRPSRANLSAHHDVVASAHGLGPVLPVRFGTVFPDEDAVKVELLGPEQFRLEAMLADFEGTDEFRIRCRYLPDVAVREVVERNPGIRKLRSRAAAAPSSVARQAHEMRMGELVMLEMERLREHDADALLSVVGPHILAWEPVESPSDDVPLHAAVLVSRADVSALESSVEKFAVDQKARLQVEMVGPLPPWDFSHVAAGVA